MQSISNTLGKPDIERLELLLKESSYTPKDGTTPTINQPKRKKLSSATVSPDESSEPPPNCPIPNNQKHFLIEEAVQALNQYPRTHKKKKLLTQWEQQKRVPVYSGGRRPWNKLCSTLLSGKPLREWKFDDNDNFTFEKRKGAPSMVTIEQAEELFKEKIPTRRNFNKSDAEGMVALAAKENDAAKGLYHNPTAKLCCDKSLMNYKSILPGFGNYITKSSVAKTEAQQVAETIYHLQFHL